MANTTRRSTSAQKASATNARTFRTFLLMQAFANAEIGARIAQARKEAGGMTQPELAELLNVSTRAVQFYEAGDTIPWKHFQRLEIVFQRTLNWFLYGDQEPEAQPGEVDPEVIARLARIEQVLEVLVARSEPDEQADQG